MSTLQQTCILVLGMHKSGTSALTDTLNLLDVYLGGELTKADFANTKECFRNNELYKVNKELLSECYSSWDETFYSKEKLKNIKNTDKLKAIIKKEFEYIKIFAIKDPRITFLFPIYKKILEELNINIKVILLYRNPMEVANSLHTRDGISIEKGLLLWGHHFLLAEKYSRGYERVFINFDDLMNETKETIKMVSKSFNIDLDEKYLINKQKIESFLNPSLKHYNISMNNLSNKIPVVVKKILALKDRFNNKTVLKKFDELRIEFFSYQKLFYNREIINFLKELENTKETLVQKEQTIVQKDKELENTKETLVQKEQTIVQKDKELENTKETLVQKEQTIVQKDKTIEQQKKEMEALKDEFALFYKNSQHMLSKTVQSIKWYKEIKESELLDIKYYIFTYPDIRKIGADPIRHYIEHGVQEGRNPSLGFDTKFYLDRNPDVKETKINPLAHYILYGKDEGRSPLRLNNEAIYTYIMPKLTDSIKKELNNFTFKPLISVIMPVYNVAPKWLDLAVKSLERQWYENWELCIVDDSSTNTGTIEYLRKIKDNKIKIKFLKKNINISGASNEALKLAKGNYIALMDNDDELTPDALYEVVKCINEKDAEFIYSDEDKLEMDGSFSAPHFKADFAPDMILSQNYISHLGVIKRDLIDTIGGFEVGLEGSQDYDLYLKVFEHTDKIYHISKVLYHWRKVPGSTASEFSGKSYAQEAGRKSLENAMKRRKIDAIVLDGKYPGTYKVEYPIKNNPLVSIVIPFKDKPELLKMCIESILNKSTYSNFEIIGISNNSEEIETFDEMKRLRNLDKRAQFYEYNAAFNYSDINNYAVKNYANGEQILLLNNDIEIITPSWIEEMLMHSQRKNIGAVGAKLYYPNDTIQHAGVIIGIGGVAGHAHKHFDKNHTGYFARLNLVQNFSAVTAACLMVKKSIYEEVHGLNEKDLKVAFNDVDFCLRVQEQGYNNIFTPYCEAYHHESISRGRDDTQKKRDRFTKESLYIKGRHKLILENGDPFYNANLTLDRQNFELKENQG